MNNSRKSVSMRMGFTVVELLVLVTSIVLLMTVLVSCTNRYSGSHRLTCKKNVQGIAKACIAYMSDDRMNRSPNHGNAMPKMSGASWSSATAGNPSALWLLVKYKFIGRDSFLCPSAEVNRDFRSPGAADSRFAENTLSYSYLSQVIFTDANTGSEIKATSSFTDGLRAPELAIIADANPRSQVGRQDLANDQRGQNSLNHDRRGQHVAFLDGHAEWFTTTTIPNTKPLTSSNAPDDIYQSCGSNAEDSAGRRGAVNDAFLIP